MKNKIIILCIVGLFLFACSRGAVLTKNYYILEYLKQKDQPELIQKSPINLSIFVMDARVANTYNRNQIVIRHSGPRITYSYYDIWGAKLSKIIPDLLQTKLKNYNIFRQIRREMMTIKPDMEIITHVNNVEMIRSENLNQARLNIEFALKKSGVDEFSTIHSVNVEKKLVDESIDTFVQILNEMLLEEMDNFIIKILATYSADKKIELPATTEEFVSTRIVELQEAEMEQEGYGFLYLPSLSKSENEPYFYTVNDDGVVESGKMGVPLSLPAGLYNVVYGSGQGNDRLKKESVEIYPRYKTIIEPDWGCLIIDVIDEQRNYAKVRYDIFNLMTGSAMGGGFPAEEEIGEQPTVYVLGPGYYKITINNATFNSYRDFTTTLIEKGEVKRLTIVVDTDEEGNPISMIGAGVMGESFLESKLERLKLSSTIHGFVNVNSDNEEDKNNQETSITLNSQLQNYLIYDYDNLHYYMKNLIEIGTSKASDQDFRLATDEFDMKNTLIYYFIKNLGLYGRFDINSHFFSNRYYSSADFYATKIDIDGNVLLDSVLVNSITINKPLFPMVLKEGIGINYRLINKAKANLSLRLGFGLRQELNYDVYRLWNSDTSGPIEFREYHELDSVSKTGTELSIVGNFLLPFNVSYNTNADFLFPFEDEENYTMEWENVFNLRLFKYISLDYKLKLTHKMPEASSDYISSNHTLFLRLTYILR
jgi:ABC-type uncharacterized transport system auxiliary subunit